jgi:hypothetical protein
MSEQVEPQTNLDEQWDRVTAKRVKISLRSDHDDLVLDSTVSTYASARGRPAIDGQVADFLSTGSNDHGQYHQPTTSVYEARLITFELFPNLPKEIRALIWRFAAQQPRLMRVYQESHAGRLLLDDNQRPLKSISIPRYQTVDVNRLPPLLRTNVESRQVSLHVYATTLSTRVDPSLTFLSKETGYDLYDPDTYLDIVQACTGGDTRTFDEYMAMPPTRHEDLNARGVIFNPVVDIIYVDRWTGGDELGTGLFRVPGGILETNNIKKLALPPTWAKWGNRVFQYLFVPHIFVEPSHPFMLTQALMDREDMPLASLKELIFNSNFDEHERWDPRVQGDRAEKQRYLQKALNMDSVGGKVSLVFSMNEELFRDMENFDEWVRIEREEPLEKEESPERGESPEREYVGCCDVYLLRAPGLY